MAKKTKKSLIPLIDELGQVKKDISALNKKEKKLTKQIKSFMIESKWTLIEGEKFKAERLPATSTFVPLKATLALLKEAGQSKRIADVITVGLTILREIAGKEAVAEIEKVEVDPTGKFKISEL